MLMEVATNVESDLLKVQYQLVQEMRRRVGNALQLHSGQV